MRSFIVGAGNRDLRFLVGAVEIESDVGASLKRVRCRCFLALADLALVDVADKRAADQHVIAGVQPAQ